MINIFLLEALGIVLGAVCYSVYDFLFRSRRAGFSWVNLLSLFVSLLVASLVLVRVQSSPAWLLFGLGSGYILLSSFAFGLAVNFFVSKPLAYFAGRVMYFAGRGRTSGAAGSMVRRAADVGKLNQQVELKFKKIWLVIIILALLIPASYAVAAVQFQASVSTQGNIKSVGILFYGNSAGTTLKSTIDWGTIEPGQTVNSTLYMKSTSSVAVSVSMAVGNFVPASGSGYLSCTWSYDDKTLNPGQLVAVIFTLKAANTITDITSFSFDIGVVGVAG
jgi:hypothetical protein